MRLSLKTLITEIIVEAAFGKKFPITLTKNGKNVTLIGIASANAKPNERKYRITWFSPDLQENRHVDLDLDEMMEILNNKKFSPEIIQRIKQRYPDSELVADDYTISA